jgi:cytochrome d ubiquinol oxidase subunit II
VDLTTVWFVLIAVLFAGYFFLEGFDYGVGVLMPFVGRTDNERRAVVATIGPVWDANEVWLITAGGAMFAAFPRWYAAVFSGFYLPLALVLAALIARGVGLEFRSKEANPRWRRAWDAMIWAGSLVPPLIWGVAMANMLRGVPLDARGDVVGGLGPLLSPYTLLGGLATVALLTLHGALYLCLKLPPELVGRAERLAYLVGGAATALYFAFVVYSYFATRVVARIGLDPGSIPILAASSIVAVRFLLGRRLYGWAFAMNGAAIVLSVVLVFTILYPHVLVSTLRPSWSMTVAAAASNPYSLRVMSLLAVGALPVVLAYQAWSYAVFRRRVSLRDPFHY